LSTNLERILLISIGALFLNFGCATRSPIIVTPPKPAQEPVAPPKEPEPQPSATPEKPEPVKEPSAPEPAAPEPQMPAPRSTVPSTGQTDRSSPRTVASLRLTEQARLLIESKKPDDAIGILEKAMNIDTNNGQNYYFLAEAWIMKGNKAQAIELNRMAGLYLNDDSAWKIKVQQQKERIGKMKSGR
jgi:tetratricopeptide (TPR) repeat protein